MATVYGKQIPVPLLIDSGSGISILSPRIARLLPQKAFYSVQKGEAETLVYADGQTHAPVKKAVMMWVNFNDVMFKHKFVVADIKAPAILGSDFMGKNGSVTDYHDMVFVPSKDRDVRVSVTEYNAQATTHPVKVASVAAEDRVPISKRKRNRSQPVRACAAAYNVVLQDYTGESVDTDSQRKRKGGGGPATATAARKQKSVPADALQALNDDAMSEDEGRSSAPPTPLRETDEGEEGFEGNKSPQENLNEHDPETEKDSDGESTGETKPQLTAAHVKYNALVALVTSTRDGTINCQQRKQEEEACQRELVKHLTADHATERGLMRLVKPDTPERVACQANLTALTHDSINAIFDMDVSDSEKMRRLEQYANGKLKEHLREGRMVFAPGPLSLGSTAPTTEDTTVGSKVGSDSEDSGKAAPKKKAIAKGGSDQSEHRDLTLSKIASVAGLSSTPGVCSVQLDALVSEVAEFNDPGQRFALKSAIRTSRDKTLVNTVNFLTRMWNGKIITYGQLPFTEQVAAIKDHFGSDVARKFAHNDIDHAVRLPNETPQKLTLRVRKLCTATGVEVEGEAEKMHFLRLLSSQERAQLTFRFGASGRFSSYRRQLALRGRWQHRRARGPARAPRPPPPAAP
ncbi:hypothetical protein JKP88DRAFT_249687 [Tribonema minus]|uniref:Uncharacterized protein n=1 Tax=Tribonema minus TaxID=303371 RepID=A0A835YIH6_9STRA|nr:hypothetical protein JKP88DRAFT_249687 [Tribonema minus]